MRCRRSNLVKRFIIETDFGLEYRMFPTTFGLDKLLYMFGIWGCVGYSIDWAHLPTDATVSCHLISFKFRKLNLVKRWIMLWMLNIAKMLNNAKCLFG